jgi:hypothetical protein
MEFLCKEAQALVEENSPTGNNELDGSCSGSNEFSTLFPESTEGPEARCVWSSFGRISNAFRNRVACPEAYDYITAPPFTMK